MYTLNQEQIDSIQGFINKIPDSMVKSHYEKWLAEVVPTERVTGEQLEKFLSFENSLPQDLQNYPQSLAMWLKNGVRTEQMEEKENTAEKANLGSLVGDSISSIPDVSAPDNQEETLHKLNTLEGTKGGKKLSASTGKKKTVKKN